MLTNGIEKFLKKIPEEYKSLIPKTELNELAPKLEEAKDVCDAGKIALPVLGELFETDFEDADEQMDMI